jgi:Sulfotransferase family
MTAGRGPSFVCIGAARAGTTWLWENLQRHPEFWVPPVKELHWFDTRNPPEQLAGNSGFKHRRGLSRYTPLLRQPSWQVARWLSRFYSGLDHDGDYCALFERERAAHLGDITPAYAILDRDVVRHVQATLPGDCRIVFTMREPVDRLWSGLRMYCKRRKLSITDFSESQLDALSRLPEHALRSDYVRTLQNWSTFGDRLGLFFYEDMCSDPAAFLRQVLAFLRADSTWESPLLRHVSNAGDASVPPPTLLERWRESYAGTVAGVRTWVGRVPLRWQA